MPFNSYTYLVLLLSTTILYGISGANRKSYVLLLASLIFYSALTPEYLLLLVFVVTTTFYCGKFITTTGKRDNKRLILFITLFANLAILLVFKYSSFALNLLPFTDNIFFKDSSLDAIKIAIPLGISFYIFQAIGYCIDVYRGELRCECSFPRYALFIAYFPQLVSGPIERANNLLIQLRHLKPLCLDNVVIGVKRIIIGFGKKVLVADSIGKVVDRVFTMPESVSPFEVIIAAYLYAIQIYSDFSGYIDIAIGSAIIFNIKLTENFNFPYSAITLKDFWNRWNITLSKWFKDYLYIPIGGNKVNKLRMIVNIIIVFLISGLWHGASFNFVIWGLYHGIMYCFFLFFLNNGEFLRNKIISTLITFNIVCIGWILFRAESFGAFNTLLLKLISKDQYSFCLLIESLSKFTAPILIALTFMVLERHRLVINYYSASNIKKLCVSDLIITDIILLLLLLCAGENSRVFVYFQF